MTMQCLEVDAGGCKLLRMMKRLLYIGILTWLMLPVSALAGQYLAAMPILEQGMTQLAVSMQSTDIEASITRAVSSFTSVCGMAATSGRLDLSVRLVAPWELAPAFFALEMTPRRVTGLMTLFFGPVSLDLGRSWVETSRWAWVQLVVHPKLTLVAGGTFSEQRLSPHIGWRLFPTGSASKEIRVVFGQDGMVFSVGGVL